ncbi:prolyl-tRNA synthetase associated domain-containing protein 1 isoform X2 [Pistacia vera]|uniref:prolyl-tRNA synthetase associated domain-containing protein 1 isoform X1 n=1 Tax=Pistacia vera TaxID=55513 RepID=UPI001262B76A|nr:prolyl-tRNA synthetase associated domain-containing protein 1 isoform X1 [Pistacia vera]XP_031283539.1 prolyl-tRNA synthetase associated domain-containing protein 1 isoform X2 [Pistacia vera]
MGYSKEQLLARLQDLKIEFSKHEHPVVMTVEAQAKYVGSMGGGLSKNLFLKDKKHRYYIVCALADTKVDMKVLSQRLGLGKGGLRMAPEEALPEILQVPLGSVTPFALVNESARDVGLLLDKGFKTQERCFFHPLSNDMSISLNANDLDKFLKSIGRDPAYVDLEANPTVGKDQPPDLAAFVPSSSLVLPDPAEKTASSHNTGGNNVTASSNSKPVAEKAVKPAKNVHNIKDKSANAVNTSSSFTDAEKFVEEILDKISAQILSETKDGSIQEHGEELGTEIANRLKKCCCSEFKNLATMFKNTAYTQGFHAGRASVLR